MCMSKHDASLGSGSACGKHPARRVAASKGQLAKRSAASGSAGMYQVKEAASGPTMSTKSGMVIREGNVAKAECVAGKPSAMRQTLPCYGRC